MKNVRRPKDLLTDWATELSLRLGRSEESIVEKGISLADLGVDTVEVRTAGGATYRFPNAFSLVRPTSAVAAVFSEHDGYIEFEMTVDDVVVEIRESFYYRHDDGFSICDDDDLQRSPEV